MRTLLLILIPFISFSQTPTSSLKLTTVLDTLNDIEAISLKDACLSTNVNKYGLNAVYVPGQDSDERLLNLQTNKKLSYFKGYKQTPYPCNYNISSGGYSSDTVLYQVEISATEGVFWLNYQAGSIPDYFDLFDGTDIIDQTGGLVSYGPLDTIGTSDTDYNYPLWSYNSGVQDTLYVRTYNEDIRTGFLFEGNCAFVAVQNLGYTQNGGVCLYFNDVTTSDWNFSVSAAQDTVFFKAYEPETRTLVVESYFLNPVLSYVNSGSVPTNNKLVFVCYSRGHAEYEINFFN